MKTMILLFLSLGLSTMADASTAITTPVEGKDYYISQSRGKGRQGSKEQPAKDLAAVSGLLKPGDRVHIAEGKYTSKTDRGTDIINLPVSIIGGYSSDFSTRDPWGAHQTVLTGINDYYKAETTERLAILTDKKFRNWQGTVKVDGIIIDNGERNRYKTEKEVLLLRKASPAAGRSATPGMPALRIRVGAQTKVEVINCVVVNSGTSQGAIDVQVGRDGEALIENNLIVNNTGEGIFCKTNHHGNSNMPKFTVRNNTILFNWTNDAIASVGGSNLMMDASCEVLAENNVFGFGDAGGVNNVKKCAKLVLKGNLFFGHQTFDYREFRSDLVLDEMEDYAEFIDPETSGNYSKVVKLPIDDAWAKLYFGRTKVTREQVDASVTVSNSGANQLRSMLGLNVRGNDLSLDADIWLHRMDLQDAIKLGLQEIDGKGCANPKQKS